MKNWLKNNRASIIMLLLAAVLFAVVRILVAPKTEAASVSGDYAEYENAVVVQILSDGTEQDAASDGG